MEAPSFVSKARTAFHTAAAKAERVFTDIKKTDVTSDLDFDKPSPKTANLDSQNKDGEPEGHREVKYVRRKPAEIKTKQDWHERFKNIRIGKKGVEDTEKAENSTMAFAIFDENMYFMSANDGSESAGSERGSSVDSSNGNIIPPAYVLKQLAMDLEAGKKFNSMRDLSSSSRGSSPIRERASLSFSAMKSLVLREKEDKFTSDFGSDQKVVSLISSLVDAEGHFPGKVVSSGLETDANMTSLPKDIHGAPPESFLVKLSEVVGSFKTLNKAALFWFKIVSELRRLWFDGQYIPGIPPDGTPDLSSCLLYQQLQVINCCISRKRRRFLAFESLNNITTQANSNNEESDHSEGTIHASPVLYARTSSGELVLRLGADKQCDNFTMLETGEPIYTPIMQEGPLLTEDLIKETEEFVLRTGSVGAGCSQLLSDMQAFKAANPGCMLEDFVRWHSPPDWTETEMGDETKDSFDGDELLSRRGQLSNRMQKEGNLWRELWETAKPVPAVKQTPLFDEDFAVEGILSSLEDIAPSELFEQLFLSLLGSGFVLAETRLSAVDTGLWKLFIECKDYIFTTCQGNLWIEKIDDVCQVYETVEMMLLKPDEVLKIVNQPEETPTVGESKRIFKKISLIFGSKDGHAGKTTKTKDSISSEENPPRLSFSSIFSKKPPKPNTASEKASNSLENDWTVI